MNNELLIKLAVAVSITVLLGIALYFESQSHVVFIYYGPNYVVRYVKPSPLSRLLNGLGHTDPPLFPSILMQVNGMNEYYNLSFPITNASLYAFAMGPARAALWTWGSGKAMGAP